MRQWTGTQQHHQVKGSKRGGIVGWHRQELQLCKCVQKQAEKRRICAVVSPFCLSVAAQPDVTIAVSYASEYIENPGKIHSSAKKNCLLFIGSDVNFFGGIKTWKSLLLYPLLVSLHTLFTESTVFAMKAKRSDITEFMCACELHKGMPELSQKFSRIVVLVNKIWGICFEYRATSGKVSA